MRKGLFLVLTVVIGVLFVAGVGTYFSSVSAGSRPILEAEIVGMADTPRGSMPHALLQISSWPDSLGGCYGEYGGPHPDWVTFCPTTEFAIPAHSLVTIQVEQYDGGEKLRNDYFAKVHGTIDGFATINGEPFNAIAPNTVGHTFTIHGVSSPSQALLFVSVPLQAADEEVLGENGYPVPNLIEFSFYTEGPGTYFWNCEFPCGDGTYADFGGPMSTQGYMAGRITVK